MVLGIAITWGVSFAVVKATVGEVSPSRLVGWRFVLATLTLLTLRPRVLGDLDRQIVSRGIVLGALLGIGFVLCTIGMQTTSVLISAFVAGTTVVFAPLIAWILLRRRLTTRAATAVFLALVGLAMITMRSFAVGRGTLLILTAAVLWALHLVALERWSRAGRLYGLTVIQLATSAAVALGAKSCSTAGKISLQRCRGPPQQASFSLEPPPPAAPSSHELGADATGHDHDGCDLDTRAVGGAGLGAALGDAWTAITLAGAIIVITAVCLVARPSGQTARSRSGCTGGD